MVDSIMPTRDWLTSNGWTDNANTAQTPAQAPSLRFSRQYAVQNSPSRNRTDGSRTASSFMPNAR